MIEILSNNRRWSGQSNGNKPELEIKIESESSNFLPTDPAIAAGLNYWTSSKRGSLMLVEINQGQFS